MAAEGAQGLIRFRRYPSGSKRETTAKTKQHDLAHGVFLAGVIQRAAKSLK